MKMLKSLAEFQKCIPSANPISENPIARMSSLPRNSLDISALGEYEEGRGGREVRSPRGQELWFPINARSLRIIDRTRRRN